MSIGLLILLIVVGFLLISIEISVVPGITFAGIAGIVLLVITIILAYYNFGYSMGNMVLIGSSVISFALFFIGYKFFNFRGIALTKTLSDSKVEPSHREINIKVGDIGVAYGDIKPQGNAIINNRTIVVRSKGEFISDNVPVIVVEVTDIHVIVKPRIIT